MNKALIVVDSRAIRGILGRILRRNGFEVCEAADGMEALKALDGEASDITLLCADYNMPEMNGVELLQKVRLRPLFRTVPAIMITTETHMETVEAALREGAEYVMKPFTNDMIIDKLRLMGVIEEMAGN